MPRVYQAIIFSETRLTFLCFRVRIGSPVIQKRNQKKQSYFFYRRTCLNETYNHTILCDKHAVFFADAGGL